MIRDEAPDAELLKAMGLGQRPGHGVTGAVGSMPAGSATQPEKYMSELISGFTGSRSQDSGKVASS